MYENRLQNLRENRDLKRLNIPVAVLHTLADFYGVSVDYLQGRTNSKSPYPKK